MKKRKKKNIYSISSRKDKLIFKTKHRCKHPSQHNLAKHVSSNWSHESANISFIKHLYICIEKNDEKQVTAPFVWILSCEEEMKLFG